MPIRARRKTPRTAWYLTEQLTFYLWSKEWICFFYLKIKPRLNIGWTHLLKQTCLSTLCKKVELEKHQESKALGSKELCPKPCFQDNVWRDMPHLGKEYRCGTRRTGRDSSNVRRDLRRTLFKGSPQYTHFGSREAFSNAIMTSDLLE